MVGAREASPLMGGNSQLQVLRQLETGPRGLVEAQAEERLLQYGDNTIPAQRSPSWPRRLGRSLRDPFTMVLLALGLVSLSIAAWATAGVVVALVVTSCLLRSSGEYRADRSTAGLRKLVATTVTVRRRPSETAVPQEREIPADQLVPGDVIKLGPGDLVAADVRLLRSSGLTVHQASLTGESAPAPKRALDLAEGDDHLVWQGSSVASGSALAVVTATGADTLFAGAHQTPTRRLSAFDRSVNHITWILVRLMLVIPPVALVGNALLRGRGLDALPFAVAVAVGLTPEMLPVVVTTALARGSALLARRGVIVKRLPALHDVGAIDVLCMDKTGTLTQDRPVLRESVGPDGRPDPEVLRWAALNSFWTLHLTDPPTLDPLDEAILQSAPDLGDAEGLDARPFDPVQRLSCVLVRDSGRDVVVVKGAVEAVLERCDAPAHVHHLAGELAADGARVLAVAKAGRRRLGDEHGLTFIGFLTLVDEPSPDAAAALSVLLRRGITPKVLTGDQPQTAARICRDLGLQVGAVIDAAELDAADLTAEVVERATVIARCTPEHKARVVKTLREAGHTVGFLGDGVNDLPAMRAADVGICPRTAVAVTREAADIVLVDKNLSTIDQAVLAGRGSTANIITYLRIALSSNVGNVIAMLAAGLALPFLPMLPVQVLVQNLCFDAAQLAFAFDRADPAIQRRPLRLRPHGLLRFIAGFGVLNAVVDLATLAILTWVAGANDQSSLHTGWFIENLLTQSIIMLLLRPTAQVGRPLWLATSALAATGLLIPLSPVAGALGLVAPPVMTYLWLLLVVIVYGMTLGVLHRRRRRSRVRRRPRPGSP